MRFLDLGLLRIERDGAQLSPGGHAPAAILSTLLLHLNRQVERDLLIDAVWGERASANLDRTLATHLWRLRRVLEPSRSADSPSMITSDARSYRLAATVEQVSSARFERLAREVTERMSTDQPQRALDAAAKALDLWQGSPFVDIADRSWAVGPIARLEELYAQLQEQRIDALLASGEPGRAIGEGRQLIQTYPLRERLRAQQMLAYYRAGRQDEALHAFHQARQVLLEELGLEPGPELTELQRRILAHDPSLGRRRAAVAVTASPVEIQLPRPRRLIGRADDQASLAQLIDEAAVVTVVGSAGCGKTAVAIETARGLAGRFTDGVWFIDLTAADADADIPALVVGALGLTVPTGGSAYEVLSAYARDRSALLVLDNCEHVLEQVASFVEPATRMAEIGLRILATSREGLGIEGERLFRLTSLPVVAGAPTAGPVGSPAARLFLARDRRQRAGADLEVGDAEAVNRICRAVDGLPLALELAAGWTETYTLGEIADQVDADPTGLAAVGRRQARRHHDSLFATIEHSYRLLGPSEQMLHRRLSVLPGPFRRELAEGLSGAGLDRREIAGLLARLVHRSLLQVDQVGAHATFTQLTTVRGHAAHALEAAGETEETETRLDHWVCDLIRRQPLLGHQEEIAWRDEILDVMPVIRTTLRRWLVNRRDPRGAEIAVRLVDLWYFRGQVKEGLDWMRLAVTESPAESDGSVHSETQALISQLALTALLVFDGQVQPARELLAAALPRIRHEVTRDVGQTRELAWTLLKTGAAMSLAYDFVAMRRVLETAGPLLGVIPSDPELTVVFETVSCLADAYDQPVHTIVDRARTCFAEADALGNYWVAFLACSIISAIALMTCDGKLGLPWARRLAELQHRLGARSVPQQYEAYADLLVLDGQLEHAVRVFSASYDTARQVGATWPRNPATDKLLGTAREQLSKPAFDRAWAVGRTQDRAGLLDPDPRV